MTDKQKNDFQLFASERSVVLSDKAYAIAVKIARNQPGQTVDEEIKALATELCLNKDTPIPAELIQIAFKGVESVMFDDTEFDPAVWPAADDATPDYDVLPRYITGTTDDRDYIYSIIDVVEQTLEKAHIPNCRPYTFGNNDTPCLLGCCTYQCPQRKALNDNT